jgi:tetratricopeptide (TPR) repeat protein
MAGSAVVGYTVVTLLGLALAAAPLTADPAPWHLAGWQERAVVEITEPAAEADVDTAGVKVLLAGRGRPDGNDLRVLDATGQPVPFELTWYDAPHYALISFRAAAAKKGQRYFVYCGNLEAERAAEQVPAPGPPGSGPPQADWIPRAGLVLATLERSRPADMKKDDNPQTEEELAQLIARSPGKLGARYQRNISDGFDPFGASDFYISLYRGWIRIPQAGPYQFCTASNEASFSFLDGKKLVHWPGRHTEERGLRGEKNALVELTAGLHYVEYYHEEVTLQQVAFLGWRPSGDKGEFSGIPDEIFTRPHAASVVAYETPQGAALRFEPEIVDSIWPIQRHEGQYTRVRFQPSPASGIPENAIGKWDFGDGQTGTGRAIDHVYLRLGKYTVTAQFPALDGARGTVSWPLEVYEIQHATEQIPDGKPTDYVASVRTYDRSRLDAPQLNELALLFAEADEYADALKAAGEYVERFAAAQPDEVPRMRRLMAECSIHLGQGALKEAVENYKSSITDKTPPAEKLEVLARLIRLLGIDREMPDDALQVIAQIEQTVKAAALDADSQMAYRHALIAAGDVYLWQGNRDRAHEYYKKGEVLSGQFIPANVRAARIGAYPNSIREYLLDGNHGAALDIVNRWEETFPTDKVNGHTFYWRGKLLSIRGQHKEAARHLARAIGLAVGADFESEARWLLALSLEQIGRGDAAQKELTRLVKSGNQDRFVQMAREKLLKANK